MNGAPDWLAAHTTEEWISAALAEVTRAEGAYRQNDARGGLIAARRAAGMGLNAALLVEPNAAWGRTYIDHVEALAKDESVPEAVREAAKTLVDAKVPGTGIIGLRSRAGDERVLEAAKDVIAHAYAVVARARPAS